MSRVSSKTHEKIMQAAQALLTERGKEGVSITEIHQLAGVSKATIYRDKEFLEWWNETSEPKPLKECPGCVELSSLKVLVKTQKAEIRTLDESLSRVTSALAALVAQMNDESGRSVPLYSIETQPHEP